MSPSSSFSYSDSQNIIKDYSLIFTHVLMNKFNSKEVHMRKYEQRETWQEELKKILDQMVKEKEEFNSQMELVLEMMEDAYNETSKYL